MAQHGGTGKYSRREIDEKQSHQSYGTGDLD